MTIKAKTYTCADNRIEVLTADERFVGLGKIWIGKTQVRSGRLPLTLYTASFTGHELAGLKLLGVKSGNRQLRIQLAAEFRPLETKMMRDHSFDPIHELGDWTDDAPGGTAKLDIVFAAATDNFNGVAFSGFAYHFEYKSPDLPIFYLLEKSSWELDGDITGATVYSQSSCSAPAVTFAADTCWSTEGFLFFLDEASCFNRCMTHNLPRWASHQAFDFQFRGNDTLIGVFDHVDLVRSVLCRDAGKPELKCFDKHIFDEARKYSTTPKAILLSRGAQTPVDQKNLWTWILDEVHARARREFGLKEQPPLPCMGHHYWKNRSIDTYFKDIVPACINVGIRSIFTENFKKSDASEPDHLFNGNMCGPHELEISEHTGGMVKFKDYIRRCREAGIENYMWTAIHVSVAAKMNAEHRCEGGKSWYIAMEDTRTKYGGAYTNVLSNLDMNNPEARKYWTECHRQIARESGLEGYFIDSFYNLFFMPVDFKTGHPRTVWRQGLSILKELQDEGIGWYIESFGPWGHPRHGHPASYNAENIHVSYYVGLGDGYTTVPVPGTVTDRNISHQAEFIYWQLAHKSPISLPLFIDGKRIDEVYGPEHRRALREYHELLPRMSRRYLQEDGQAVLWHDADGKQATIWNFVTRDASLPGRVKDLTTGTLLPRAKSYRLQAHHTYAVTGTTKLPVLV